MTKMLPIILRDHFMIGGERGTGDGLREKSANLTDPKEPVAIPAEAGKR
jgi:hypothetical protein